MADLKKEVKDFGWDHITLSNKDGFQGAAQAYDSTTHGKVALCFNYHEAFVIEDSAGLFNVNDLRDGIIKAKGIDIEATGQIEGLTLVAWESNGEDGEPSGLVEFDEEQLDRLGLNDFSVKESITKRILLLSALDKLVDIPLN